MVLAVSGCSSGKGVSTPATAVNTTSLRAATSTVATAAPTNPPTTAATTTTAGGPYATFITPDSAAAHLIDGWRRGDRAFAGQAATSAAVSALFAQPYPRGGPENRGCNAGIGGVASCFYRVGQTGLSVQLADVDATQWRVVDVQFLT